MLEKGTIGREEDIEAKEAEVRGLEGRVVEAKIQLDDCTLRAPYDGVIAQRFVEQNQNVRAKEPVVKFQDVDEIDVAVDVPETFMAADLRSADIVQMFAEFSGAPGLQFPVHISEVAQVADPMTQTFQLRVGMKAPAGREFASGHDGHRHAHLPPREHPGQSHSGADFRRFQGCRRANKWPGSLVRIKPFRAVR